MSKVKIQGNASGTGVVTLTAPNTNTDRTITLPDETVSLTGAPAGLDDVSGVARATSGLLFNGDTAAANTLDDYETGTWTPTVTGSGLYSEGTFTTNNFKYKKIGSVVNISGEISVSDLTGDHGVGYLTVTLPFTSDDSTTDGWRLLGRAYGRQSSGSAEVAMFDVIRNNTDSGIRIDFRNNGVGGGASITSAVSFFATFTAV